MARRFDGGVHGEVPASDSIGTVHQIGWLTRWSPDGPEVDFPSNAHGPLTALTIVPLDEAQTARAIASNAGVLLLLDRNIARPVVVGLVQPIRAQSRDCQNQRGTFDIAVDGDKLLIEGSREVVIRCGSSSITLRQDKVIIRGLQIETSAAGVHRIKGGSVRIN